MSTEEPAWMAELSVLTRSVMRGEVPASELGDFMAAHIQAAEERGRREAARALLERWPHDYSAQECARFLDPESP